MSVKSKIPAVREKKGPKRFRFLLINALEKDSIQYIYPTNIPQGLMVLDGGLKAFFPEVQTKILSWDLLETGGEFDRFTGMLLNFKPDAVGISSYSNMVPLAMQIAARVRAVLPDSPVILGGIHATSFPEGIIRYPMFDYYVRGEGVRVCPRLLRFLFLKEGRLEEIPSLAFKEHGKAVLTPLEVLPSDMDVNPPVDWSVLGTGNLPRRDLVQLDEFFCLDLNGSSMYPYETSQGCNQHCAFCERVSGTTYRAYSAQRVASDIAAIKKAANVRYIFFADEHMHRKRRHFDSILEELGKIKDMGVRYYFAVRADEITKEQIDRMIDVGGAFLHVFPESASARIRSLMGKNLNFEKALENTAYASEKGLFVFGGFLGGWVTETEKDVGNNFKLAEHPMFDFLYMPFLWALAKSKMGAHLETHGIKPDTMEYFDYLNGHRQILFASYGLDHYRRIVAARLKLNIKKANSARTGSKLDMLGCRLVYRPVLGRPEMSHGDSPLSRSKASPGNPGKV